MKNIQHYAIPVLLLCFLVYSESIAQEIQWAKTYGGTGDDGAESIVSTNNGGIVIAGFKSSNSVKDVLLMRTDSAGSEIWSRTYNLGINDWGRSLKQTQDGGFIIAGMTEVVPQIYDPFLIKTDSAGNVQWQQQYDYGFGDDDRAHAVWQTSDGGYIIAGQTWLIHGVFGNYDIYIIKTDMNGNVQWRKVFYREEEGGDVALAVQQLSDGGFIIGGFTQSSTWASYIIRTDNLGNAVWSNIYPGSWQSECYDIQATPDGGFILTGTETSFSTDGDVVIIKLNANGNLIWKKIYGSVDSEQGEFIQQLNDGGYVIAGMSAHGAGGYDMYVLRTNSTGDSLWTKTIGGFGDDRAFSIVSAPAGSYFVGGWTWSIGLGLGDVYLVKIQDSALPVELTSFTAKVSGNNVNLNWATASETNNHGFEIQRSQAGKWSTVGFVQGKGTSTQLNSYAFSDKDLQSGKYTYRLKQLDFDGSYSYSSSVEVDVSAQLKYEMSQNYPNPFNPTTKIHYSIPEAENVKVSLFNLLGQKVQTLVNEFKQPGNYTVNFNAAGLNSGLYLYKIEAGNFTQVKKMTLLK